MSGPIKISDEAKRAARNMSIQFRAMMVNWKPEWWETEVQIAINEATQPLLEEIKFLKNSRRAIGNQLLKRSNG